MTPSPLLVILKPSQQAGTGEAQRPPTDAKEGHGGLRSCPAVHSTFAHMEEGGYLAYREVQCFQGRARGAHSPSSWGARR